MKRLYYSIFFALSALFVYAGQKQVVVIDGNRVDKNVKTVSYQGTKVHITYSDGTTQTADRSAFAIYIKNMAATAVTMPKVERAGNGKCYTVDGKAAGKASHRGVVIQGNKKRVVK